RRMRSRLICFPVVVFGRSRAFYIFCMFPLFRDFSSFSVSLPSI
uniref:Uncharacterized protein n=1 Tax=Aegilops tauschii subsp. strangulata TaxID=200361 RepID=A0A452ZQB7_AEGTS